MVSQCYLSMVIGLVISAQVLAMEGPVKEDVTEKQDMPSASVVYQYIKPRRLFFLRDCPTKDAHFSPDGKQILLRLKNASLRVTDAQTGKPIHILEPKGILFKTSVIEAVYSPDGQKIAGIYKDNTVKIWDAQKGRLLLSFKIPKNPIAITIRSDSQEIATISISDCKVSLWDAKTGGIKSSFGPVPKGVINSDRIFEILTTKLEYSFDQNRLLVVASKDGVAQIWSLQGQLIAELKVTTNFLRAIFHPDGDRKSVV
jgi:WD40 repeat protein